MTYFNTYPLFYEDKNPLRQAYNRVTTAKNILESHGSVMCKSYLSNFKDKEAAQLFTMAVFIKKSGVEEASRQVHINSEVV